MGVGVWKPGKGEGPGAGGTPARQVDEALIRLFLELAQQESLEKSSLEAAGVAGAGWVMRLEAGAWDAAEALDDESLVLLVRLFTRIEALPGWDAGKRSPVIPLVRLLKAREAFSADLRKWIKANSDNRYLPYGSAL